MLFSFVFDGEVLCDSFVYFNFYDFQKAENFVKFDSELRIFF